MRFRKKPIVIEAEQYRPGLTIDGVCSSCMVAHPHGNVVDMEPHVHTLEGLMNVSDGDWIITGIQNEKYPCKDDIFRASYDPE